MQTSEYISKELQEKPVHKFSMSRPILVCFILFIIALLFKWIDTFVLRMDERLGELIISKTLGFIIVLAWLWLTGRKVADIGLHSGQLWLNIKIGVLTTIAAFIIGYSVECLFLLLQGLHPSFYLGAVDSKMGVTGGFLFALWLVLGNFMNSFMEEGLFRGAMGRLARRKFGFWQTNLFQAFLFSIWHLPWVLKYYQLGQITTGSEIAMATFFNSVPQLLIGVIYGYIYLKTGSLWGPWIAHVLNNSIANILHVTTVNGVDTLFPLRMSVYTIVMGLSMIWVNKVVNKNQLPGAEEWR
jgi:membrane protease YdiL (CAAX protease family)